ncbi:MAG: hypothetical protein P1U88_00970 [Thalassobaculaceae bacterium]|nr:hypothetical protein [Thalassobaculaceae bacterium]
MGPGSRQSIGPKAFNAASLTDEEHITCEGGYCYRGRGRTVIGSPPYR